MLLNIPVTPAIYWRFLAVFTPYTARISVKNMAVKHRPGQDSLCSLKQFHQLQNIIISRTKKTY